MADVKVFFSFQDARRYVQEGYFYISWRGVLLPFWWRLNGSPHSVIFTPGRTRREKPVPIFQRTSYARDIDVNVICLFDPTLFQSKSLMIGWFIGTRHYHYAELYARVIPSLLKAINVSTDDTLVYGTSGGGIPGLWIAKSLPGSTAYVSNIQTDVTRYLRRHYDEMLEACFPRMAEHEVIERFGSRFSVFAADGPYQMICAQNRSDEHHYQEHFLPFYSHSRQWSQATTTFCTYDDPVTGHDVLPREAELKVIESVLAKRFAVQSLPSGKHYE